MFDLPPKVKDLLETFASMPLQDRIEMLIGLAAKFKDPPPDVATRPFLEAHRVPGCESEAFVWGQRRTDRTMKFYFAVENPQGISAKATAVILDKILSGTSTEDVLRVPAEIIFELFGQELSLRKNVGLTNMLVMCQAFARQSLSQDAG